MKVGKQNIPQFEQLLGKDDWAEDLKDVILVPCEEMVTYIAHYQAGFVIVTVIPLNLHYQPHRACLIPPKDIDQVKAYPAGMVEAMSFDEYELQRDPDAWRRWIQLHFAQWCDDTGWAAEDD